MIEVKRPWRVKLPIIMVLADFVWAYSALTLRPGTNAAASVSAINSSIWIFLHLPAAILGGLPFAEGVGQAAPLAPTELFLIASLGLLQMGILGWWVGRILDKKRSS